MQLLKSLNTQDKETIVSPYSEPSRPTNNLQPVIVGVHGSKMSGRRPPMIISATLVSAVNETLRFQTSLGPVTPLKF